MSNTYDPSTPTTLCRFSAPACRYEPPRGLVLCSPFTCLAAADLVLQRAAVRRHVDRWRATAGQPHRRWEARAERVLPRHVFRPTHRSTRLSWSSVADERHNRALSEQRPCSPLTMSLRPGSAPSATARWHRRPARDRKHASSEDSYPIQHPHTAPGGSGPSCSLWGLS